MRLSPSWGGVIHIYIFCITGHLFPRPLCTLQALTPFIMVRILKRGITLFHTYSRNKSDLKDKLIFHLVFEMEK